MSVRNKSLTIDGGQDILVPAHLNFGKFIFDKIRQRGDEIAVHDASTGEEYTYKTLTQLSVDLSVTFSKLGMGKGDVVILNSDSIQYVPTALAVIYTGATLCPKHLHCGRANLEKELKDTSPNFLICTEQFWNNFSNTIEDNKIKTIISSGNHLKSAVTMENLTSHFDVDTFVPADVLGQGDVAIMYPSSGTSGFPKAVQLTHLNCILHCSFEDYKFLSTGLFCKFWGVNYYDFKTFMFLASGKKMVYTSICTLESALKSVEKYKVDILFAAPMFVYELADANQLDDYDLSSLKFIHSRSAPLHQKIIEKIKKIYPPNVEVVQAYGMTECGELASGMRVLHGPKGLKLGSVGIPSRGIILKVVHPESGESLPPNISGEICVKGAAVTKGYVGVDSATYLDKEGFLKTKDLGYYDEDGYFYVIDRLYDIMIVDSNNVAPALLETVLQLHPGVKEAGVVGIPHLKFGDLPAAFVVKQQDSDVTEQELISYVQFETKIQLHGGVHFVSELPRNERGKILRRKLKEMVNLKPTIL